MSYEARMKMTVFLISFLLLAVMLLISTIFSSGAGTAKAQESSVIATIPVGMFPLGITVNATNGLVYVANGNSSSVSVIDPSTNNTVVATIPVGNRPVQITVNPTNGLVYVANLISSSVSVIDPSTNTVIATIPVGTSPLGITVNATNGLVYVTNSGSNTVSVISTESQPLLTATTTTTPGLDAAAGAANHNQSAMVIIPQSSMSRMISNFGHDGIE